MPLSATKLSDYSRYSPWAWRDGKFRYANFATACCLKIGTSISCIPWCHRESRSYRTVLGKDLLPSTQNIDVVLLLTRDVEMLVERQLAHPYLVTSPFEAVSSGQVSVLGPVFSTFCEVIFNL